MPRNTREWARRKLDEAMNNLDWVATHLNHVATVYEKYHPEISNPLKLYIEGLSEIYVAINNVKKGI